MNKSVYKENEPTETPNNTAGFAVNFIWLCLAALFWPRCVLFMHHGPTERIKVVPHQIIKLVELCQGRFVVENLLSSALAQWKDLLESEG